jgi:hypothetical protein
MGLPVRSAKEMTKEVMPMRVLYIVNLSGLRSRKGCINTCPISLRSLENDAAAGVMRDMTMEAKLVDCQEHSNERDVQPPEKKPYKIPKAMVPPRFVAANMRNNSPPDMTVHGIITVHRRL